jgi:hypothetical protein
MGILRAFVKELKPERALKNKNIQHPKNLKIIESFEINVPNIISVSFEAVSPIMEKLYSPSSFKSLSL